MNKKQKAIIIVTVGLVALSSFHANWKINRAPEQHTDILSGQHYSTPRDPYSDVSPIWDTPPGGTLDIGPLCMEWLAIAGVGGVLFFLCGGNMANRQNVKTILILLAIAICEILHAEDTNYFNTTNVQARAESGDSDSQYNMGMRYWNGWGGLPQNQTNAFRWFQKSSDNGYPLAQSFLAGCYLNGWGTTNNLREAIRLYSICANRGSAESQIYMGYFYESGSGVIRDYVIAYKWYDLAAQQNDYARAALDKIEAKMSKEQIADGQRMAREFSPN